MMHQRLGILLPLLLLFFATAMNSPRACNDIANYHVEDAKHQGGSGQTDQHNLDDNCVQVSDDCSITHPGQDCPPDSDGCGHCHCPGCGSIFNSLVVYTAFSACVYHTSIPLGTINQQAFYFAEHVPERPYLPIWQPPQIKA